MSVKLARYVFRRIRGRIVPIRIGAEAKTLAAGASGVSSAATRKLNLLVKHGGVKVSAKGNLLHPLKDTGGSEGLQRFMEKTGAIRFMPESNSGFDFAVAPTLAQKKKVEEIALESSDVYLDVTKRSGGIASATLSRFDDIFTGKIWRDVKLFRPTKAGARAESKALKELGTTNSPKDAGFITRDGDLLDLSGGYGQGRIEDHRIVAGFAPERRPKFTAKRLSDLYKKSQRERKINSTMKYRFKGKKKK